MSTDLDLDRRLRRGLRELADAPALPLPVLPACARPEAIAPRRRGGGFLVPVLALTSVLLIVIVVSVPLLRTAPGQGPASAAVLPSVFPALSAHTPDISREPMARALAVYEQSAGSVRQVVLLGTDGDTHRQASAVRELVPDRFEYRRWLLSPDGSRLAVAGGDPVAASIGVLEVSTGNLHSFALPQPAVVRLLAWSADGYEVAYVPTGDGRSSAGQLTVLDVRTGRFAAVPGQTGVSEAAFARDGRIAVQVGTAIRIVDRTGLILRDYTPPEPGRLVGGAAWSPDDAQIAVSLASTLSLVSPATGTEVTRISSWQVRYEFQGWFANDAVVALADGNVFARSPHRPTNLWFAPLAASGSVVADLQLAWGLLPGVGLGHPKITAAGQPIRWAAVAVYSICALLVLAVVIVPLVAWRRHKRRPPGPPGDPAAGFPKVPPVLPGFVRR